MFRIRAEKSFLLVPSVGQAPGKATAHISYNATANLNLNLNTYPNSS